MFRCTWSVSIWNVFIGNTNPSLSTDDCRKNSIIVTSKFNSFSFSRTTGIWFGERRFRRPPHWAFESRGSRRAMGNRVRISRRPRALSKWSRRFGISSPASHTLLWVVFLWSKPLPAYYDILFLLIITMYAFERFTA